MSNVKFAQVYQLHVEVRNAAHLFNAEDRAADRDVEAVLQLLDALECHFEAWEAIDLPWLKRVAANAGSAEIRNSIGSYFDDVCGAHDTENFPALEAELAKRDRPLSRLRIWLAKTQVAPAGGTPPSGNLDAVPVEADKPATLAGGGLAKRDAKKGKRATVAERMAAMLHTERDSIDWTQCKWAQVLNCSAPAIAAAPAWQNVINARAAASAQRRDGQLSRQP
jgi:hypothetical protein